MKKIIIYYLCIYLVFAQIAFAAGPINTSNPSTPCMAKTFDGKSFLRLCNNVEDIICKDVNLSERRSCDESKQDVFRKNLSVNELGLFLKTCFGSAFTSFKQFFTEFIPELLKGIWDLTKATGEIASNSITGKGPTFWDKMKGAYESVASISSDVYEAASNNPSAFMKKFMDKISDAVGPLVANFDCLKPELKVGKVCGFVAEWVVPPIMLAKMLVKGTKLLKAQAEIYGFAKNEKKVAQYAKAMEKMDEMAMKEMQFEERYKALGYTKAEFDQIVKSGTLKNFKVEEIKVATSKDGWQQRLILLGKKEPLKVEAKPANHPIKPKKIDLTSDNFSVQIKRTDGSIQRVPGQILGKSVDGEGKINYHIRVYDPVSGKMKDANLTEAEFTKLIPKNEDAKKVEALMNEGYKKNPKLKPLQQEYDEAVAASQKASESKKVEDQIRNEFKIPKGVDIEHIPPSDPRYRAIVGEGKYDDGLDFVPDPEAKKLQIIKEKDLPKKPSLTPKPGNHIVPHIESNYITIRAQNAMGTTAQMNAQVLRQENVGGKIRYVVKMWDSTTQSFIEKKLSANELLQAGAKASDSAEKEILKLKQSGVGATDVGI